MYVVEWEMGLDLDLDLDLLKGLIGDNLCLGLPELEGHGHVGHRTSGVHTCTSTRRGLLLDRAQAQQA
jgi:hypothetical protein